MNILHVITSLEIGGAQRLLSDLIPLQAKTDNVTLLVYERVHNEFERKIEEAGVQIVSMEEHNFHNSLVVFRMRKFFRNYDIVHAHLFPTIYWASLACRGLKVKLVYTEHSTSNSRREKWYFRPIEQFMYSRYDRIISISLQTQNNLTSWLHSHDNRFVVVNNGVDTKYFSSIKKSVVPKSLIMVSRFASSKDQETVIRAMRNIDSGTILRFVGDGENLEHCKLLAKECGVDNSVEFLGARSDVAELIAESYIGVQSSNWEGFGLTAVELMSCGKPVVASDVDGLKQVVEGAGLIFQKGNSKDLADKINLLLENKKQYAYISEQCSKRASEYDIQRMSDKYIGIYKELLRL